MRITKADIVLNAKRKGLRMPCRLIGVFPTSVFQHPPLPMGSICLCCNNIAVVASLLLMITLDLKSS